MMQQLRSRGLALTLACVMGLGISLPAWSQSPEGELVAQYRLAQQAQTKTVAIVDFENHTGDKGYDNLKRGVSESLMSKLAQRPELILVERSQLDKAIKELGFGQSVYADANQAKQIGKMLNADYIVTGSVVKAGSRFEINVRMIEVETGRVHVSESYGFGSENEILPVVDYLSLLIPRKLNFYVSDRELDMARDRVRGQGVASNPNAGADNSWIWWTIGGSVVAIGAIIAVVAIANGGLFKQNISQTVGGTNTNSNDAFNLLPQEQSGLQVPLLRF
ncbi:MAG: hypothetical protein CVV27_01945 [Candidatus Melainabacteria bacterium HGW-Melainabacteria-1]|nr:MAG: hypothetical protein CVV27_01945 [Candidatus Melainabacteria bacterium HGW-Melainabacteria-1]